MKFCPECGAKYDGSGRCRSCHTRFAPDTISEEEANELRLFRDFELERTEENGIRLLSCTNREIEFFVAPPTVAELGHSCFSGCSKLEVVDLSATALKEIPSYCFADCKELFSVILPSSLETIGPSAFAACESLDDIPLPDQLGGIDSSAFAGCSSLDTINLPSTLRCVRENAFRGCELLCEVNITDLAAWCSTNFYIDSLKSANPTYRSNGTLYLNGTPIEGRVVVPAATGKVGEGVFYGYDDITEVVFEEGITVIGGYVFPSCTGLSKVTIPNTVKSIGSCTFYDCDAMEEIVIPDSVTEIGWSTFYLSDGLSTVTLGKGIKEIGGSAFKSCPVLSKVKYRGSEADRAKIKIGSENTPLTGATWEYNVK